MSQKKFVIQFESNKIGVFWSKTTITETNNTIIQNAKCKQNMQCPNGTPKPHKKSKENTATEQRKKTRKKRRNKPNL